MWGEVNAWLPGNTCVYVDVMLGRSCSSMLQNDLLLIERERKSEWKERWGDKVGMQGEDEQVHWFGLRRKDREGQRERQVIKD